MNSNRRVFAGMCVCAMVIAGHVWAFDPQQATPVGADMRHIGDGSVAFEFDASVLQAIGWTVDVHSKVEIEDPNSPVRLAIDPVASTLKVATNRGIFDYLSDGELRTRGALLVYQGDQRIVLGNLAFRLDVNGRWLVQSTLSGDEFGTTFAISSHVVDYAAADGRVRVVGELVISGEWAQALGQPELANVVVGRAILDLNSLAAGDWPMEADMPAAEVGSVISASGPDVIVGNLHQANSYGTSGGIAAFAIGTISCNIGDTPLNWFQNNNQHPVIGQNMFRLKNGRFEQIGQGWLKHGFFALSETLCSGPGGCAGDPSGTHLGVGCSDPYSADLNGQQGNLGPRSQVNPWTGVYPFPFSAPSAPPTIGRRVQVHIEDLDPPQNVGAQYFVEGQYVTPDDAAAGNQNNNASYRPINVLGGGSSFTIQLGGPTQRERPGIRAWVDTDPTVTLTNVQVPGDGLLILGAKATDLGGGVWRYEYALQNLNSHRAVGSFGLPVFSGAAFANIGFHDVDSHSGEPYSNTDWTSSVVGPDISWTTDTFAVNQNANAIRWGTLYNFRFDVNAPPVSGDVTIGLFRPGSPNSVTATTIVPQPAPPDCNNNGILDPCDISCAALNGTCNVPNCGQIPDCAGDGVPDACEADTDNDGVVDSCDACPGFDDAQDADSDTVPDGCDVCAGFNDTLDADGDGVPNDCDNCVTQFNPSQSDVDSDNIGDPCDPDQCDAQPENEHFAANPGWSVVNAGATTGNWVWGIPAQGGVRRDPPTDFDGGSACYVTGNGFNEDVDGGGTQLLSPNYPIAPGTVTLTYAYWIGTSDTAGGDSLVVSLSADGGTSWTPVRGYTSDVGAWLTDSVDVRSTFPNAETVRVRFTAIDGGTATILEAGVDAVEIAVDCLFDCTGGGVCNDNNQCTTDTCNNGVCEYTLNSLPCDDGDACTSNDVCFDGTCSGGGPPPCTGTDCTDCNNNGIRDECDGLPDCNNNNIPDQCEFADCNGNSVNDVCDIATGTSDDCDGGPIGVEAGGAAIFASLCFNCHASDGSGDFGPDIRNYSRKQIWTKLLPPTTHPGGAHPEYGMQGFADLEAFLAQGGSRGRPDNIPDECQTVFDCDSDLISDACELESGTQTDTDYDGLPDSCSLVDPVVADAFSKNRYISFVPGDGFGTGGSGPVIQALRVRVSGSATWQKWVGPPDANNIASLQCTPHYRDWGNAMLNVTDLDVRTARTYSVQGIRQGAPINNESRYSTAVNIGTVPLWGDVVGVATGSGWTPPNGFVNVNDVTAEVHRFEGRPFAPPLSWMDIADASPNRLVNVADIQRVVLAFGGANIYPFNNPQDCP